MIEAKLFKILGKYCPETRVEKKARLAKLAADKSADKGDKPNHIKFGLNHVTELVESKKAQLVVIAHDVDPVEMVVFLPTLCRKFDVPYCFVRGKANLGKFVHMKTATCVALTAVNVEDRSELAKLRESFSADYNKNEKLRKTWGGGVMGIKNQHMMTARAKVRAIEDAKKEIM